MVIEIEKSEKHAFFKNRTEGIAGKKQVRTFLKRKKKSRRLIRSIICRREVEGSP